MNTETTPTSTPTTNEFSMRGSMRGYFKGAHTVRFVLAAAISLIIWIRFGWVAWVIVFGLLILAFALVMYLLVQRSVVISNGTLRHRNMLLKTITVPLSDIKSVKFFTHYFDATAGEGSRVSIQTNVTPYALSFQSYYWNAADLQALAVFLKNNSSAEVSTEEDPHSYADVAQRFPEHATYLERHPGKVAVYLLVIILVVIFGGALAMTFWF